MTEVPNSPIHSGWNAVARGATFFFLFASCNETLPPYSDPRYVLSGTANTRYVLFGADNSMKVDFVVTNTFDETLEATAVLQGGGQIVLQRNNNRKKTFSLTTSNMVAGTSNYNPATGVLKLDPGASITFRFVWDFVDDVNNDLRQLEFDYVQDPSCSSRMIAYEETFIVRAQMKVYEKVADVVAPPAALSMCHVSAYIDPRFCPPIQTDQPCSYHR